MNKAKPGDADYCETGEGCWFCHRGTEDDLVFDVEFDTPVHIGCIRDALKEDPNHPEARWMKYLLPEYDGKD
jgi:hypothetical protein